MIQNTLSCSTLIAMGRDIPTPFHLSLDVARGQSDLRIDNILRLVPGKRLTALSSWNDRAVIVKLFFGPRHWKRNMLKDLGGVNLLKQADILTPALLLQTHTADQEGGLLLTDYLEHGENLGDLLQRAGSEAEWQDISRLVIGCIGDCHRAGLLQADMHLDNFMVSGGRIYVLDGGDIVKPRGGLSSELALDNLALYFAQFPVSSDDRIPPLLEHYRRAREGLPIEGPAQFQERLRRARARRIAVYEKKLFRSTTEHHCLRRIDRHVVYDRHIHGIEIQDFIRDPDSYIGKGELLKAGNSSTVASVRIGGNDYVVKRYNVKGVWHGLKRLLQPSRAHHSWRNAAVLKMLGIATPHPYLYMERRLLWLFRHKAYFLCEKIEGRNLLEESESAQSSEYPAEKMANAFAYLFRVLGDYRISHGDMKASNFIFRDDRLYVLDLDAMKRHKSTSTFSRAQKKDKARFMRNWQGQWLQPHFQSAVNKAQIPEVE